MFPSSATDLLPALAMILQVAAETQECDSDGRSIKNATRNHVSDSAERLFIQVLIPELGKEGIAFRQVGRSIHQAMQYRILHTVEKI